MFRKSFSMMSFHSCCWNHTDILFGFPVALTSYKSSNPASNSISSIWYGEKTAPFVSLIFGRMGTITASSFAFQIRQPPSRGSPILNDSGLLCLVANTTSFMDCVFPFPTYCHLHNFFPNDIVVCKTYSWESLRISATLGFSLIAYSRSKK